MTSTVREYVLDFNNDENLDFTINNIQENLTNITSPSLLIKRQQNENTSPLNKSLGRSLTLPHHQNNNNDFNDNTASSTFGLSASPLNSISRRNKNVLSSSMNNNNTNNKSATSSCFASPNRGRIQHQETQEIAMPAMIPSHLIISPQRNSNSNSTETSTAAKNKNKQDQQQPQQRYFNPEDMLISPTYNRGGGGGAPSKKSLEDLLMLGADADDDFEIQLRPDHDHDNDNNKEPSGTRYFDDDFNLLEDDDTAEELQRLRDVADERQQRIFDLQAELAETKEAEDELQGTVEMLRSELRSVRSAMSDAGNNFYSPTGSAAAHFASPSALRELQMQLLRSGNNINLLGSPSVTSQCCCGSANCNASKRREHNQLATNEMGTSMDGDDDEFVLEQSMRSVNKKLTMDGKCNDDDDDDDDFEDDVDDYSLQVSGTFLLPPKAIIMAHKRQLMKSSSNKNKTSSTIASNITLQEQLLAASVNSADLKRGGKINLRKLAKFAANANMKTSKFSFKWFLFDILNF